MDLKEHTKPENLLRYSFMWNQIRLVIAAFSLLLGGSPLLYQVLSSSASGILTVAWVISGLAGVYLLYAWYQGGKKLFGGNDKTDLLAFIIATFSGIHLGLGGLFGTNIIMSVLSGFLLTLAIYAGGLLYLWSAWHLHKRYKEKGEKLF